MISLWNRLYGLVNPRRCLACGDRIGADDAPVCPRCRLYLPRTDHLSAGFQTNDFAQIFYQKLPLKGCFSLYYYARGSSASRLLHALKYRNHPELGRYLGRMLAQACLDSGFFDGVEAIVPVPLAPERMRARGYNQSVEIALGLQEATGISVISAAVKRSKFLSAQITKNLWERNENVTDVFKVVDADAIRARRVLMVDDVITTGSTLCALGTALLQAGAAELSAITVAMAKP